MPTKYLIVGGGIAGTSAAETIRREDPHGEIRIVSDEPYRLYSRIMISKPHYFLGKVPSEQIWLKSEGWYADNRIELLAGRRATALDAAAKRLTLDDGSTLDYDKLLLALGVGARRWEAPGADKRGIYYVRTLDDYHGYQPATKIAKQAVVIGGGAIGFEMCDLFSLSGLETTLIIREPHYWDPVLDAEQGQLVEQALERGGVKIIRNQYVTEAYGGEAVEGVVTQDGTRVPCQLLSVGIGGICPIEWLKGSGVEVNRGILADDHLATSASDVWAAGDVAEYADGIFGERVQFGSWSNAQNQGRAAALNMTGKNQPYRQVTFYAVSGMALSIAFIGCIAPVPGRQYVTRGSLSAGQRTRFVLKDGHVVGATMINRNQDLGPLTKLIDGQVDVAGRLEQLADVAVDLKTLL